MEPYSLTQQLISLALAEDTADGDATSQLSVPEQSRAKAEILAKDRLVLCGLDIIDLILKAAKSDAQVAPCRIEGDLVDKGDIIATLEGSTRDLLLCERSILNFLQRLSGVATHVHNIVSAHPGITILDTRKTMPGWRTLEKYAVRIGGGSNHRFNLGDMILVKNNHIDAAKIPLRELLSKISHEKSPGMRWEVEVRNAQELKIALEFKPDMIMLDNMSDAEISASLPLCREKSPETIIEVSGGIRPERLHTLRNLGVTHVSMGSLTTHAANVDISMRIHPV